MNQAREVAAGFAERRGRGPSWRVFRDWPAVCNRFDRRPIEKVETRSAENGRR